jgi:hypothetical protein
VSVDRLKEEGLATTIFEKQKTRANKSTQASGTDNAKKLANAVKRHHLTASPKATIYTALVKRRRLCLPPQRFAFPRFVTAGDSCFLFFPPLDLLFFSPDTYTLRYIVFSLSSNIYYCLIYFYTKKRQMFRDGCSTKLDMYTR